MLFPHCTIHFVTETGRVQTYSWQTIVGEYGTLRTYVRLYPMQLYSHVLGVILYSTYGKYNSTTVVRSISQSTACHGTASETETNIIQSDENSSIFLGFGVNIRPMAELWAWLLFLQPSARGGYANLAGVHEFWPAVDGKLFSSDRSNE